MEWAGLGGVYMFNTSTASLQRGPDISQLVDGKIGCSWQGYKG